MDQQAIQKQAAAKHAIKWVKPGMVLGVGTGSTVSYFIEELASIRGQIDGAVSSSEDSTQKLKAVGIPVVDLNSAGELSLYVDGADEINPLKQLIKGGGGALTREKVIAAASKEFVCIADSSKVVKALGKFPLPIEVIPMARSFVGREIYKKGATPVLREGFTTDNGNIILDVHQLNLEKPHEVESWLNEIPGVVTVGLFAHRKADVIIVADKNGNVDVW